MTVRLKGSLEVFNLVKGSTISTEARNFAKTLFLEGAGVFLKTYAAYTPVLTGGVRQELFLHFRSISGKGAFPQRDRLTHRGEFGVEPIPISDKKYKKPLYKYGERIESRRKWRHVEMAFGPTNTSSSHLTALHANQYSGKYAFAFELESEYWRKRKNGNDFEYHYAPHHFATQAYLEWLENTARPAFMALTMSFQASYMKKGVTLSKRNQNRFVPEGADY